MTDSEDPPDPRSGLLDLGETFLNALGDGAGDEWRDEINDRLLDEGEIDYDALLSAGIAAGEQTARLRNQARQNGPTRAHAAAPDAGTDPVMDVRDIHGEGGEWAGTRITCSEMGATAYLAATGEEVVVKTGSTGTTVDLPTTAAGIADPTDDGDATQRYVAYAAGGILDPEHTTDTDDAPEDTPEDTDEDE